MIQIIPKWRVNIFLPSREVVVWISDSHISNVLRTITMMDFSGGVEQPTRITVELEPR